MDTSVSEVIYEYEMRMKSGEAYRMFSKRNLLDVVDTFDKDQYLTHAFTFHATKEQAECEVLGMSVFCMVGDVETVKLIGKV